MEDLSKETSDFIKEKVWQLRVLFTQLILDGREINFDITKDLYSRRSIDFIKRFSPQTDELFEAIASQNKSKLSEECKIVMITANQQTNTILNSIYDALEKSGSGKNSNEGRVFDDFTNTLKMHKVLTVEKIGEINTKLEKEEFARSMVPQYARNLVADIHGEVTSLVEEHFASQAKSCSPEMFNQHIKKITDKAFNLLVRGNLIDIPDKIAEVLEKGRNSLIGNIMNKQPDTDASQALEIANKYLDHHNEIQDFQRALIRRRLN